MGSGSSKSFSYDEALLKDKEMRAHIVAGSEEDGYSPIYRNSNFPEGFTIPNGQDGNPQDNVWALFENSSQVFAEENCMGWRPFEGNDRGDFVFENYQQTHAKVVDIACGMVALGLQQNDTVGIYSKNRAEWMQIHLANQRQGFQTVALYDTLGDEAVSYILGHADIKVAFSELSALDMVLAAHARGESMLETVVVYDYQECFGNEAETVTDEHRAKCSEAGLNLLGLTELMASGQQNQVEPANVTAQDVCFLMYTSGTTGNPKGVQLSHEGFCMISFSVQENITFETSDRHVSFLPLAHIFECLVETVLFACGASVAYYQGNIKKLTDDWVAIQPTFVVGVPRVFSKVYDKVMAKAAAASCMKKWAFNSAFSTSAAKSRTGERSSMWDNKVWKDISAQMGFGECKVILSGAAPLPPYLAEFLRIVCVNGCVVQGYGLTESTGGSVVQFADDLNLGNVGVPLGGVDIRLQDIGDMGYLTTDENPRGEVLIRGASVMQGYYKNPEKTAETLEDGWLHTGDVGRLNPNGTLSIIDRKKNLFKTSFGEYIAVEAVESCYQKAGAVGQIWVYGNSFKSFVVAVVVPDALWLKGQLEKKKLWPASDTSTPATDEFAVVFNETVQNNYDLVKELVLTDMKTQEKELKKFSRVKDILIVSELDNLLQGFSVENDLLTPSFKMKRPILLKRFVDELKILYTENGEPPKEDEHWVKG